MPKTVNLLNSLLDTRRLLRSIRLSTDRCYRELNKSEIVNSTRRSRNVYNDQIRAMAERIYQDSKNHVKILKYIQTILKTHLNETTRLNGKMQRQASVLLEENQKLVDSAEGIMEAYVTSTKLDTPLNLITKDLIKKFTRDGLQTTDKMRVQDEKIFGIICVRSALSPDVVNVVINCEDNSYGFKTFMNDLPAIIDERNFTNFVSPGQAYKAIKEILVQDGVLRNDS